jgi:hypothetical protein
MALKIMLFSLPATVIYVYIYGHVGRRITVSLLAEVSKFFGILVPIMGLLFKYQFIYHKGGAYVTGEI